MSTLQKAHAQATRKSQTPKAVEPQPELLTTTDVARMLGVSSVNTVKNWLEGGAFPGATRTLGGHWRFRKADVDAVLERMQWVRERNAKGDLSLPDDLDEGPEPPLL